METNTSFLGFNTQFSMKAALRGVPWGPLSSTRPFYGNVWPSNKNLFSSFRCIIELDLEISNWNHISLTCNS